MTTAFVVLAALLVAVLGALIAGALATSGKPDLARVSFDQPGRLVVEPLGMMKLLGFSGAIDVPLSAVAGAEAVDVASLPLGIRLVGTGIPGIMRAGRFGRPGQQSFWLVGRSKQVLAITLDGERYVQLAVQVGNPAGDADRVNEARGRA